MNRILSLQSVGMAGVDGDVLFDSGESNHCSSATTTCTQVTKLFEF